MAKIISDLPTKELLMVYEETMMNTKRLTIKADDKTLMSIDCWNRVGMVMYTTAELPYGDNGKINFPENYNFARILKTRTGWELRGVAQGIIASHIPNDDTAFRTMEGRVVDVASDEFKQLINQLQGFSRPETLLAQQTMWNEISKTIDPRATLTSTEAASPYYATLCITALTRETRNRIFADPSAIDEGINEASARTAMTLAEFNKKAHEILLWMEAESNLQGLPRGQVLPSTFRRMRQGLQQSMLNLPAHNPAADLLRQRVSAAVFERQALDTQDPELLLQIYRLAYASAMGAMAQAAGPAAMVMHVTDRPDRNERPQGPQGRGAPRGRGKARLEGRLGWKPRSKTSPKDDTSPPKKPKFNVPLSERLDNSDQSLKALIEEVGSLRKQLAEIKSGGSALHAATEQQSDSDGEYEEEPVYKAQKGPAGKKQEWTRVRNSKVYMASLIYGDDSDSVPDLDEPSGDKEEPKARKSSVLPDIKSRITLSAPEPVIHQEECLYAPGRSGGKLTKSYAVGGAAGEPTKYYDDSGDEIPGMVESSSEDEEAAPLRKLDEPTPKTIIDSGATTTAEDLPELAMSSDDDEPAPRKPIKQVGTVNPEAKTSSASLADNKAAKATTTKTQKGSPMENLTNAPRRSVRTPTQVEHYKPTSRSVNVAQAENDAKGKPYASKGREGATKTRAGREPEGARRSTTSENEPVEVHYLMYVDDIIVERDGRRAGATTPPTPA